MVSFGDNEDFKSIKGFNNLQIPEEVEKSIKLMKNNRYKFNDGGKYYVHYWKIETFIRWQCKGS